MKVSAFLVSLAPGAFATPLMNIMYLTGQHTTLPPTADLQPITHVNLAFLPSTLFNTPPPPFYPIHTPISTLRRHFPLTTKFLISIGGWGDTSGFDYAAQNTTTRTTWSANVAAMLVATGADGVDIDWEYPGGNGEDYKIIPNSDREWEIAAYPELLREVRKAIGGDKLLTVAVPGLERDMMGFTGETVPKIMESVDFLNVMAYDLMNRRDTEIKHHTGIQASQEALDNYVKRGASSTNLALGFAFYAKWFKAEGCNVEKPVGCKVGLMEDPETGGDLGRSGAFSWNNTIPAELETSLQRAFEQGQFFEEGGHGYGYLDGEEDIWWSFDVPGVIEAKFEDIIDKGSYGGVFAWGLGEDGPKFEHLREINEQVVKRKKKVKATPVGNHDEL